MFIELEPLFYYYVFTKTLNMCIDKCKSAYLDQYLPRKIPKALWGENIHTLKYEKELLCQLFKFM